ncbi:hypothetical protein [Actinopolymorpha sp. B9G3]|uniref:Vgb family protein n=1 Tax=Actinopolymorpha sp. B9G3 TaxID=3158970 RepID=UPI0032D9A9D2
MPQAVSIEEYAVPDRESGPYAVTTGPDNALWFTMVRAGRIGRMTTTGEVTSYPLEPATGAPTVIVAGPDGALWFTEYQRHRIGRITTTGEVRSFDVLTAEAGPYGLAAGPGRRSLVHRDQRRPDRADHHHR